LALLMMGSASSLLSCSSVSPVSPSRYNAVFC
jgi:hypothetical protein